MSQELAIIQMHSEGASPDEICNELKLPIAVVDEVLDQSTSDDGCSSIALPIIDDMPLKTKAEIQENILKQSNFIVEQVIINLNRPEQLNSLGKASIILQNINNTMDKLKVAKKDEDNKFSKYLKD